MIKATFYVKVEVAMKPKMGVKTQVKTIQIPVRISEPGRTNRQRLPDLTRKQNQDPKILGDFLTYPSLTDLPAEVKPI